MTKNEERINKLFKELVPETGKADSLAGELVRCHSANYLEAFSSVYLETNSGSNSVMGILNCCCPAK